MQYNIEKILELIEEIENEMAKFGCDIRADPMEGYHGFPSLAQKFDKLDAQLRSLNRYVEAVARVGAMALESNLEAE